jgi:LysR family transcriptional regulator, transcription activator of glutamate synthase operon
MELRQLRYFTAVATLGGFRRAADALSIAQPAVSQQVRRLEAELGTLLFERDKRPVALTPAGEQLLVHAQRLLADADSIAADMRRFTGAEGQHLTLGVMQYLTLLDLPELLVRFRRQHPGIEVTVNVGNSGELEALLRQGQVELAIAHAREGEERADLAAVALRREELVLLVDARHRLARRERVDIAELAGESFVVSRVGGRIRETFDQAARAAGFETHVAFETVDMTTTVGLVARGLGLAVAPRAMTAVLDPGVVAVALGPEPPSLVVTLLRVAGRRRTPAARVFSAFLKDRL